MSEIIFLREGVFYSCDVDPQGREIVICPADNWAREWVISLEQFSYIRGDETVTREELLKENREIRNAVFKAISEHNEAISNASRNKIS